MGAWMAQNRFRATRPGLANRCPRELGGSCIPSKKMRLAAESLPGISFPPTARVSGKHWQGDKRWSPAVALHRTISPALSITQEIGS